MTDARDNGDAPWWSRPSGDVWTPRDGAGSSAVGSSGEVPPEPEEPVGDAPGHSDAPGNSDAPGYTDAPDTTAVQHYASPQGYSNAHAGWSGGQSFSGQGYAGQGYAGQGYTGGYAGSGQGAPGSGYGGHGGSPWGAPLDTLGREDRPRKAPRTWMLLVLGLAIALVAGGLGGATALLVSDSRDDDVIDGSASLGGTVEGTTEREAGTVAGVAGRLLPSVVSFEVRTGEGRASGSGFVIREDGYILTNNHVVRPAADGGGTIAVQFNDGREAEAEIVGRDVSYDLAVVKVSARNLPVVRFGDSDAVVPGDPVLAIGSPLGLSGTVTSGIVSALNRPVTAGGDGSNETSFISAIQTDAAINPGNSGGPLVNLRGEVVGVNSAIATLSGGPLGGESGSIGLGFAIPMNQAKVTAEQLIRDGRATHPVIGVSLDPTYTGEGAQVARGNSSAGSPVRPGGPAAAAGIEPGDIIVEIDGEKVQGSEELIVDIRSRRPGDVVELLIRRGDSERTVKVTLEESSSE